MADTPLDRTVDDLQLQAWLAAAELREPSLRRGETVRTEIDALSRIRDEVKVQLALGKLEARDRFEALEKTWFAVKSTAERSAHEAGESVHDLLRQIRDGYQGLGHG